MSLKRLMDQNFPLCFTEKLTVGRRDSLLIYCGKVIHSAHEYQSRPTIGLYAATV